MAYGESNGHVIEIQNAAWRRFAFLSAFTILLFCIFMPCVIVVMTRNTMTDEISILFLTSPIFLADN